MNKNIYLALALASFVGFMVLLITKLEFVMAYGFPYAGYNDNKVFHKPEDLVMLPALPEAVLLGWLLVILAILSIFFAIKALRLKSN